MQIRHFFTSGLCINSYLVFDEETRQGVAIDPTRQVKMYLARAKQEGIKITDIVETHVHADFVSGAPELKAALGGKAVIHCSGLGGREWVPSYADHVVKDRDAFRLGAVRLEAWHTPGHTPEHLIWVVYDERRSASVPEIAFTGDLLFVGSVGRPDLLGAKAKDTLVMQLYHSLFVVLNALPDFVEVYPAHGAGSLCGKAIGARLSSTVGYEKISNPWLVPQEYQQWLESLQIGSLPIPGYFSHMKGVNVKGPNTSKSGEMPPFLTAEQVKKRSNSTVVVDLRRPDDFAAGNISGSINLPLTPSFPLWAGLVLPVNKELLLVVDRPEIFPIVQSLNLETAVEDNELRQSFESESLLMGADHSKKLKAAPIESDYGSKDCLNSLSSTAVSRLSLVGFDNILGVVDVNAISFVEKKELFQPSPQISVETLHAEKNDFYLLDVRNDQEWNTGHIEGAHLMELARAAQHLEDIPADKPVAVICHSGNRASIIASLLKKERGITTFNVKGGMQAWIQAKLPLIK